MHKFNTKLSYKAVYCVFCATLIAALAAKTHAGPFISEVFLPSSGTTGIEVDGLGSNGATLLVIDASSPRLTVDTAVFLGPSDTLGADPGGGVGLVVGPDWNTVKPAGTPQPTVPILSEDLFEEATPYYIALLDGQSLIGEGISLGTGAAVAPILAQAPIVDWIGLAVDSPAQSSPLPVTLSETTLSNLGIDGLPRPSVSTGGAASLARALTPEGPVLDQLLLGTLGTIDAEAAGLENFALSPGRSNPPTLPLPIPEPGLGLVLVLGLLARRGRSAAA